MELATFKLGQTVRFSYYNHETQELGGEGQIQNNSEDFNNSLAAGNVVFLSLFDENKKKFPVLPDTDLHQIIVSNETFLAEFGMERNKNNVDFWLRLTTKEHFCLVWNKESSQYFLVNAESNNLKILNIQVKEGGRKTQCRRRTLNRFTRRIRLTKKRVRARRHTFRSMRQKANATKRRHKR